MGNRGQTRKVLSRPRVRSDVRWRITANTLIIVGSIATLVALIVALELHIDGRIGRLSVGTEGSNPYFGTRGRCLSANSYLGATHEG